MNEARKIWGYQNVVNEFQTICFEHSKAQNIVKELNSACDRFASGVPNQDDMTVLILTTKNFL